MNAKATLTLLLANALAAGVLISAYALWFAPPRPPRLAVLDVGELYRLKEAQVTTLLVKRDATEDERTTALRHASAFGMELTHLIESLPGECRCLILARGALVGPANELPDLTPEVRRRLGL